MYKKSQMASTITWIVAFSLIVFITVIFLTFSFGIATRNKIAIKGASSVLLPDYDAVSQTLLTSKQATSLLASTSRTTQGEKTTDTSLIELVKSGDTQLLSNRISQLNKVTNLGVSFKENTLKINKVNVKL